jgi:hypothetical protein
MESKGENDRSAAAMRTAERKVENKPWELVLS